VVDLTTSYAGLTLRNPLMIAPAGITGTAELAVRAEDAGAGAVVMKSLFENPIPRAGDPSPHMRLLERRIDRYCASTFYSYEQCSPFDESRYAEEIQRARVRVEIPIIASLDCITSEGWIRYARLMEEAGAHAVEIKSCPHGLHQMSGEELVEAMKAVREATHLPIVPKLLPQDTNPLRTVLKLEEAGADAVVMFNRFSGLDIDVEAERPIMHGGYAGHGGPWSIYYSLRWITAVYPHLSISISGSGGVWEGDDLVKYILAGATTVQVCSAVCLQGYGAVPRLLTGLQEWMAQKGYTSSTDFRGRAAEGVLSLQEIDRQHLLLAQIDPTECTGCGLCAGVCIYSAIESQPEHRVLPGQCIGCGLCVELCPVQAIHMKERTADRVTINAER
jgi:dihydroorotate dehydrogenase (fumarate)